MRGQGIGKTKSKDKNLSHWRLKAKGVRLELSLFRDKIPSEAERKAKNFQWNLDEVLMTRIIFTNAAKNEPAKEADLQKAFHDPTHDPKTKVKPLSEEEMILRILEEGSLVASQEDRVTATVEEGKGLQHIAVIISKICFSIPEEDAADKKARKKATGAVKLDRFASDVIERELKNSRFKITTQKSENDIVRDAIRAIRVGTDLKLYRDGRLLTLTAESDESKSLIIPEFTKLGCPCWRLIDSSGRTFKIVADGAWVDEQRLSKLSFCELDVAKEIYLPKGENDDLVFTPVAEEASSTAERAKPKKAADAAKKAPSGKPKGKAAHDDDDEESSTSESDSDDGLTELERELKKLKAADSPKAAAKPAAKPKAAAKAASKPAAKHVDPSQPQKAAGKKKSEFESSSDDENDSTVKVKPKKGRKKGRKGKEDGSESDD